MNCIVVRVFILCVGLHLGDLGPAQSVRMKVDSNDKKLLLILLDGFRWDYFNKSGLDGFAKIQRAGVQAEYSVPIFPSLSYPNYYSIVTGLYAENHGIMLNSMYNSETDEVFDSSTYWWDQAEPLWITATKAGKPTAMYLWPGCNVRIRGVLPYHCVVYSLRVWVDGLKRDLKDALDKFESDKTDVALVYCEQPDLFGHLFGPESFFVDSVIRKIDAIIDKLVTDVKNRGLQDKLNIIIVSDHGMTAVDSWAADKIPLKDYIDLDDIVKIVDRGAVVAIHPVEGKVDAVYRSLKKMPGTRVWKKNDIPAEFHYKDNIRTAPILLLADKGYFIKGVAKKSILSYGAVPPSVADSVINGFHGYDPTGFPDMRGIFLALGPDFKNGVKTPPIENQDVYNLAMALLGLQPRPNNGTWASVVGFLKNPPAMTKGWH